MQAVEDLLDIFQELKLTLESCSDPILNLG